jgi:hypothetical protein
MLSKPSSLQFCGNLRLSEPHITPHRRTRQTSYFILQKHVHMCTIALTSSTHEVLATRTFLHMSILDKASPSYSVVRCCPSTAKNCRVIPIATANFVNRDYAIGSMCSMGLLYSSFWSSSAAATPMGLWAVLNVHILHELHVYIS